MPYFDLGPLRIEPYGILVVFGTALGIVWLMTKRPYVKAPEDTEREFWALVYAIVLGGLIGGKGGYLLVERETVRELGWDVVFSLRSGWVFWFAVAGSILAGRLFQLWYNRGRAKKRRYLPIADYIISALPLGHLFGRIGCFTQGCCHGAPSSLPWAVAFTHPGARVRPDLAGVPLHPTQLYEAAGEAALAAFLILHVIPNIERKRYAYGTAFFGYILLYSLLRFSIEFLRADERGDFLWPVLSPSQWFSAAGIAVGAAMLWRNGIRERDPAGRTIYFSAAPSRRRKAAGKLDLPPRAA